MRRSIHRHTHHHHHHHDSWGARPWRRGRRRPEELDAIIAFLEERQRDLEQAAADVAGKIQRLKRRRDATAGATSETVSKPATGETPSEPATGESR